MLSDDFYFFNTIELENIVEDVIKNNKQDVIQAKFDNNIIWIKRPRESKSNLLHKLSYSITKIKGLMPVESKTKDEALYKEVSKLKRLKEKNINVPKVLACREDLFVLEDTGTTIKSYLKSDSINSETLESTLEKTVKTLSLIHNNNEYHAGPQIKNYTIKNDIISAIDFEDSFNENINLKDIQFRDFFLFLVSLTELNKEVNYKEIINIYQKETNNPTVDKELKDIALKLNFLIKIVENKFLNKLFSKDVINNYNLFKTLQNF